MHKRTDIETTRYFELHNFLELCVHGLAHWVVLRLLGHDILVLNLEYLAGDIAFEFIVINVV